jgi:surfactin synthase thioesterase subunit
MDLNLICLPFAGGNKYSYRTFESIAPEFIKMHTVEYPGRGQRMHQPLLTDINSLVIDVYDQIRHLLDKRSYAIYGHSMGGLIAGLLTRKIIDNGHRLPLHVFITGTTGPSASSRDEKIRHLLPKNEFIQELKALNGSPDEILSDPELLDFFEPILRADFQASETYAHTPAPPMKIPFTVITGTEEDMKIEDIHLWQEETTQTIDFRRFPGKHFFIYDYPEEIMKIISKKTFNLIKYHL